MKLQFDEVTSCAVCDPQVVIEVLVLLLTLHKLHNTYYFVKSFFNESVAL